MATLAPLSRCFVATKTGLLPKSTAKIKQKAETCKFSSPPMTKSGRLYDERRKMRECDLHLVVERVLNQTCCVLCLEPPFVGLSFAVMLLLPPTIQQRLPFLGRICRVLVLLNPVFDMR